MKIEHYKNNIVINEGDTTITVYVYFLIYFLIKLCTVNYRLLINLFSGIKKQERLYHVMNVLTFKYKILTGEQCLQL